MTRGLRMFFAVAATIVFFLIFWVVLGKISEMEAIRELLTEKWVEIIDPLIWLPGLIISAIFLRIYWVKIRYSQSPKITRQNQQYVRPG